MQILGYNIGRIINFKYTKVGGMTFIRLGRLSISFCITNKPIYGKLYNHSFNEHVFYYELQREAEEHEYWEEQFRLMEITN